jgi:hypothetical protein
MKSKIFVLVNINDGDISTLDEKGNWQMDDGYSVNMKNLAWILLLSHEVIGEL